MSGKKTALIFGIGGQDGSYLAKFLLDKGYTVFGSSRDRDTATFANLTRLGIIKRVHLHSVSLANFRSVAQAITLAEPQEIYNLAAQSSVGLSFDQPVETIDGSVNGTVNILESIRLLKIDTRLYNASSSESFGDTTEGPANEKTPFNPRSPYGIAKAAAHWLVSNYREAYGLFACSGILFNHESPLRPARFVTQKVVRGAFDIAQGKADSLSLGNLDIHRDWGWAPDYVDAMWRMLQQERPEDFVIATGKMHSLAEFVERIFEGFGLDWTRYVRSEPGLLRPVDIAVSVGNAGKAKSVLGWEARVDFKTMIGSLVAAEIERRESVRVDTREGGGP